MKQARRVTRKEKKEKFITINAWLRGKAEKTRKEKAQNLNKEFQEVEA